MSRAGPPATAQAALAHVWHPYTESTSYLDDPLLVTAADGCFVFDSDGRRYVDAISGLWNVQVGYGRSEIARAVATQVELSPFVPLNGRTHPPAVDLARRLVDLAPGALSRVFYATGGAEAVETAVKIARQFWRQRGHPEKSQVVGLEDGWHGCTLGALAAGGVPEEQAPFEPLGPGFPKIPAPRPAGDRAAAERSCDALERLLDGAARGTIAAFVAEPVMGVGGMVAPAPEFWDRVQELCRRSDVLLIVDEVATGFGRTGAMFASDHYAIEPDLLTCAKGLTSGYVPLAAVLATERVHDAFTGPGREFLHGYTFGGHPVACAAAIANLGILQGERLPERALAVGRLVVDALRRRLDGCPVVGEVRGLGLMIGVELADPRTGEPLARAGDVCSALRRRGVLARPVGHGCVVPLLPPLVITEELARDVVEAYAEALHELSDSFDHKEA